MPPQTSTQQDVIASIAEHLGVTPQDVNMEATLMDDLGLGPIEFQELITYLSNTFNVRFDPSEVRENVKTVRDLVALIEDLSLE
jgi:acyl carrier protein